ncbi:Conidiation protein 6-domain-containing protein [Lactarius hatsudake]|nr:Conidiation protein 6-domain-containing protein [Lactarius hatsudake]KAH8979157.1 Conidiation protein 6-domain-containing protein [Lactarius hatsudake]
MSESQNRVVGGHKAAMHNPNVSAEAKEHSRQVVEGIQGSGAVQDDYSAKPSLATGDKEESRVIGGYKAALKNPNVSEEAKERAQQILEDKDAL